METMMAGGGAGSSARPAKGSDGAVFILGAGSALLARLSGSGEWIVPPDVTEITVVAVGGGGGAGNARAGDAGRVTPPTCIEVKPGDRFVYVAGTGGGPGEDGGDTYFGPAPGPLHT